MRKELNIALTKCTDEILPDGLRDFKCIKKARSGTVFTKVVSGDPDLHLFIVIEPDNKQEEIVPSLDWSNESTPPLCLYSDIRAIDIMGREHELDSHEFPLRRLTTSPTEHEYILMNLEVPFTLEQAEEYFKPLPEPVALELVRKAVADIRADLEKYAIPYLEWVLSKKNPRAKA